MKWFPDSLLKTEEEPVKEVPTHWSSWLRTLFPNSVKSSFSSRHKEFWKWVWSLKKNERPHPFIMLWPRKGAKSTNAELAVIAIGAKGLRRYAWYCSETQEQADKHLETMMLIIEKSNIGDYYPGFSDPQVGKHGSFKGWRRNRMWTKTDFIVDAIGLDTARRGARVAEDRVGLFVADDIDGIHDTLVTTQKKIDTFTKTLLPAGSDDMITIFAQNLVHPESIATRLSDGRADFLSDAIISGPHVAIKELAYESKVDDQNRKRFFITAGIPTWTGQDLEACQKYIDTEGLTSFLGECQHEVEKVGGMYAHIDFRHCQFNEVPELVDGCVWVDPAVTSTDKSDRMGIQADGISEDDIIYRFFSWEEITTPLDALKKAILKAIELKFDRVGVETDQGGDLWEDEFERAWDELVSDNDYPNITKDVFMPEFVEDKAGAGHGPKVHRGQLMLADYEKGMIVHVIGTHITLEKALRRFPDKPLDLSDAAYWSWDDLRNGGIATGMG